MYQRTEDGSVINPPVISGYERDLYQAMSDSDEREIKRLSKEYETERTKLADRRDDAEREEREEQELKDLEMRERLRAQQDSESEKSETT
jgi:hypothetical protein